MRVSRPGTVLAIPSHFTIAYRCHHRTITTQQPPLAAAEKPTPRPWLGGKSKAKQKDLSHPTPSGAGCSCKPCGLPVGQQPAPIHALVMLPCPASNNAAAHAVRKRIASISACSANATICAHRQCRTSCKKSAASKLKQCKRVLQARLQAASHHPAPRLTLLHATVPARQAAASTPPACSFSACGKNAACNKKAVQQKNYFSGVVFLIRALLCQCWCGPRVPHPFLRARKVSYLT